jgi:hypothetical protein
MNESQIVEEWHPAANGRPEKFVHAPHFCGDCAIEYRSTACRAHPCGIDFKRKVVNRG